MVVNGPALESNHLDWIVPALIWSQSSTVAPFYMVPSALLTWSYPWSTWCFATMTVHAHLLHVCVCSLDGTISGSIFLNSLSAWYSFTWKPFLVRRSNMDFSLFRIYFLPRPRHRMIFLWCTFLVIVVKYGCLLLKQNSIWSGSSGYCFRISDWMGIRCLNSTC